MAPHGFCTEPPHVADCLSLLSSRPRERATAECFFRVAQDERAQDASTLGVAAARLKSLSLDRSGDPWFDFYFGSFSWDTPAVAEAAYRDAVSGFRESGEEKGEVLARTNLRAVLDRLGRAPDARAQVEEILRLTEGSSSPEIRAWGRLTRARDLLETGRDLAQAYLLLRDMELPGDMEDSDGLRRNRLVELGRVCLMIGRFREAKAAFEALVALAAAAGNQYSEASARSNLAWVAYEKLRDAPTEPRRAEAIRLSRKALQVAEEAGHTAAETLSTWYLGNLITGEKGMQFLRRCERSAENSFMRSLCLNPIAGRLARTDPLEATRLIEVSRALAVESGDGWAEVRVWQEAMHVAWTTEPAPSALRLSSSALDAIESLRDRQPVGSDVQAGVFSIWSDDYAWLVGRLLEEHGGTLDRGRAFDEAFRVSERMRSRALAGWLRRLRSDVSESDPSQLLGVADLQASLEPEEALLSFQIAPWEDLIGDFAGGSWVMVITRGGVTVHRLPGRVEVRRDVQIFEGLVEARNGADAGPAARLYEKLLAPALADLPASVTRLVLVPDDALHRLPFAALRASADAPPLGARFELVQVPSATLWLDWRREREAAPARPLLVLADPDVAAGEAAPGPAPVQVAQVRDAAAGLGRLPHARAEGRAAVRALGDGLLLMGPDASEAQVATLPLGDFGLVHFAAHAVTDEDRPERSAVLLAPGRGDYDGRLESAEIAGLHLDGRTVVLASCRSASGSVLRGEGVMSLARAFFQAGAHGVVASLWPLRDDESEALFGRFYRHLANGESVAAALHAARTEAIAAGEPAAAWAGLVVLGDGSVVPVPGGRAASPWTWAASAGLALLLAAAVAAGAVAARRSRARRA